MTEKAKSVGQKFYEKYIMLRACADHLSLVLGENKRTRAPCVLVGLDVEGAGFVPLARMLTANEIEEIQPLFSHNYRRITQKKAAAEALAFKSVREFVDALNERPQDPDFPAD